MTGQRTSGRTRPLEVRNERERAMVRMAWSDGHIGEYSYAYLRGWCPCAACQGHGGTRHFLDLPDAQLTGIHTVGTYALGLTWQDGHDTGIYSYSYLRGLCPCQACLQGAAPTDG